MKQSYRPRHASHIKRPSPRASSGSERGPRCGNPSRSSALPLRFPCTVHHIICDYPDANVKDAVGVSFWIAGAYLPREGKLFCLEDGTVCGVKAVAFKVGRVKGEEIILAMPNVYAVRVKGRGKK